MIFNCKGVIFDFNGTLFFDSDKHVLAWGRLAEELRGCPISYEELLTHFYGVPNNRAIEYLLQKPCDEYELTKYSEKKEAYYRELCNEDAERFHLADGACRFFEKLKQQQIAFTIASASIKDNIDFFIESFDLSQWFSTEKIVYDDGRFENKVQMFLSAAEMIGVPISECLIFDDSDSGIRDAYKAGCRSIIVVDSMGVAAKHQGKPGVIRIISNFNELL